MLDTKEERSVTPAELKAGIRLQAGHEVVLIVSAKGAAAGRQSLDAAPPPALPPESADGGEAPTGPLPSETAAATPREPAAPGAAAAPSDSKPAAATVEAALTSAEAPAHQVAAQIVNVGGIPQPNVKFELALPGSGAPRSGVTDSEGFVRFKGLDQAGSCTLVLRDFEDDREPGPANTANAQRYRKGGVAVQIDQESIIEVPPRSFRGRLVGMLFETEKTFLLPSAMKGIRGLKKFYDDHPGFKVLVSGHADRAGPADYNLKLSEERAQSIAAFLRDDVEDWLARYGGSHHSKQWGIREDQMMLSVLSDGAVPFYSGPIDGIAGPVYRAAVKAFQQFSNASKGTSLTLDGIGKNTRRELVRNYQAQSGTTLPEGTELRTHGCGEFHPEIPTADGVEEPKNRRVEIFFFEGAIEPQPQKKCPAGGCAEFPQWVKSSAATVDFAQNPGALDIAVTDPAGKPVPGAEVELVGLSSAKGRSDDAGAVHFADLIPGDYTAVARKQDFITTRVPVKVGSPAAAKAATPETRQAFTDRSAGLETAPAIRVDAGTPGGTQLVLQTMEASWEPILGVPTLECDDASGGKPILAQKHKPGSFAALRIHPSLKGSPPDLSDATAAVEIRHAGGSRVFNLPGPITFDANDEALVGVKIDDALKALDLKVNQNLLEATVLIKGKNADLKLFSKNLLHVMKQKIIVFIPGVCGSTIRVASRSNEDAFPEVSLGVLPDQPFKLLRCERDGFPAAGNEAIDVQLFRTFLVDSKPTDVYQIENLPQVVNPANHPRLLVKGSTLRRVLHYQVVPWPYDWRLRLEIAVDYLMGVQPTGRNLGAKRPSLQGLIADAQKSMPLLDDKVAVACHSTGGLIARGLLRRQGVKDLVDQAFFIDVPFWGAPKSYFVYLTGDMLPFVSKSLMRSLAPNIPVVYYLAPSEDYPDEVMVGPDFGPFLPKQRFKRRAGQDVFAEFMRDAIRHAVETGAYPDKFEPYNQQLEAAARAYHNAIRGDPEIGLDRCTIFFSNNQQNNTPGPVLLKPAAEPGGPIQKASIGGDGTVPSKSQVAATQLQGARLIPIATNPDHVPAPNEAPVWVEIVRRIGDTLTG